MVLWLIALALDYGAPLVTFWVPGLPRVDPSAWELETSHFAERFQLFVIIALGESIVLTGATLSDLDLDAARVAAFGIAFLGSAALWWLYFDSAAALAQQALERSENRTLAARDAYTYLHVVIVLGVIVAAVGDELVIAHPTEVLPGAEVAAVVAGPAIYLVALSLFRLRMAGSISPSQVDRGARLCGDRRSGWRCVRTCAGGVHRGRAGGRDRLRARAGKPSRVRSSSHRDPARHHAPLACFSKRTSVRPLPFCTSRRSTIAAMI